MKKKTKIIIGTAVVLLALFVLSGAPHFLSMMLSTSTYTKVIETNWGIDLPEDGAKEVYSFSEPSFHGDGIRYHVIDYPAGNESKKILNAMFQIEKVFSEADVPSQGFNDLATLHPHLAAEWSDRNGTLTPDAVNEKSTKNVWWSCSVCGNEYKAVIKSRVHGLSCPVCAERAVLAGYNDLVTTDPELALEWDSEKNGMPPSEISRHSLRSVWWKGRCGHTWKDKVANRAIDKAGCIYCENELQGLLPQLLVMLYARRKGVNVVVNDEKALGFPLDLYIPELRLAFLFPYKNTQREKDTINVIKFLCEKRSIVCEVISSKQVTELCAAIKRGFLSGALF